jgi:hypothetical protein
MDGDKTAEMGLAVVAMSAIVGNTEVPLNAGLHGQPLGRQCQSVSPGIHRIADQRSYGRHEAVYHRRRVAGRFGGYLEMSWYYSAMR